MSHGLDALTEKEKQALRLLVAGYDAKSMARHLELSVHTINERLRDARRKLEVSSSREAARMLRQAETQNPKILGDKHLGDAAEAATGQPFGHAASQGLSRRAGWTIGGIIMSLSLALLAWTAMSGSAPTTSAAQPVATISDPAAVDAARRWLALLDAGDWTASWNATGKAFKVQNTEARWADISARVRPPMGAVLSRQLLSDELVPAPPNGYRVVKFKSSFARNREVFETLSLVDEAGSWKVVGYMIDSDHFEIINEPAR